MDNIDLDNFPEDIKLLFLKHEEQRRTGNYKEADIIREEIRKKGYVVSDQSNGSSLIEHERHALQTGLFVLFGSGEISSTGRTIHEYVFQKIHKDPINVSIITTPAGFQPNVMSVNQEIADFFHEHLSNFHPQVTIVPAHSSKEANDPSVVSFLDNADYIFTGPGSPTYTIKNLRNTLLLKRIEEKVKEGTVLSLSSAATIAFSHFALPVYEIYKVGTDLYWEKGLNFFEKFYNRLTVIPHFNNTEGGEKTDTSRCFMGVERYEKLKRLLPGNEVIWGIDEHTGVVVDYKNDKVEVLGKGKLIV